MDRILVVVLLIWAALGFIGWLGGGRKWAFRTMLGSALLAALGIGGVFLYSYATDRGVEHRTQRVNDCAIAKVATAKCTAGTPTQYSDLPKGAVVISRSGKPWADVKEHPNDVVWDVCPPYWLPEASTPEQESAAIAAAEEACAAEIDPKHKSLHEQLGQYRKDHGIVQQSDNTGVPDDLEKYRVRRLNPKDCATKVRTFYPGSYDDLDDNTLTKKVLAKYPTYCDVTKSPPDFIPDVKNIR
jgi:hypothetical protein